MDDIIKKLKEDISSIKSSQELSELKAKYLGKKGSITELSAKMKEISNEQKKDLVKL